MWNYTFLLLCKKGECKKFMQGLKVKFDERSISDLKQNFDNLIKDLENKSTININFNQDAFKNINNQIDEINNKLTQVGN